MCCSVSILASDRERARVEVEDSPRWTVLGKNTDLRGIQGHVKSGRHGLVDCPCLVEGEDLEGLESSHCFNVLGATLVSRRLKTGGWKWVLHFKVFSKSRKASSVRVWKCHLPPNGHHAALLSIWKSTQHVPAQSTKSHPVFIEIPNGCVECQGLGWWRCFVLCTSFQGGLSLRVHRPYCDQFHHRTHPGSPGSFQLAGPLQQQCSAATTRTP